MCNLERIFRCGTFSAIHIPSPRNFHSFQNYQSYELHLQFHMPVLIMLLLILQVFFIAGHATEDSLVLPSQQRFTAALLPKLPMISINNASIAILEPEMEIRNATEDNQVLLRSNFIRFPHVIAEEASRYGYAAVLLTLPIHAFHELARINYWNSHSGPIPVYCTIEEGIDWNAVDSVTLKEADRSYFLSLQFYAQSLTASSINILLAGLNLRIVLRKLRSGSRKFSPGLAVLVLELLTVFCIFIYFIDPFGVLGIFPFSFMYSLLQAIATLSFAITYILWRSILYVIAKTTKGLPYKATIGISYVVLFVFFGIKGILIWINTRIGFRGTYFALADVVLVIISQIPVTIAFIKNKAQVIHTLKYNCTKSRDATKLRKSAVNLVTSTVFMFFTSLLLIASVILISLNMPKFDVVLWYLNVIVIASSTVARYFQILSVSLEQTDK